MEKRDWLPPQSLAETFMFRYKTIVGDRLSARKWQNQVSEVRIKLVLCHP